MKFYAIALFGVLCAAPAGATEGKEYREADAGCLVYSVGTIKIGMKFTFPYKRVRDKYNNVISDWNGNISPSVGGAIYLKIKNPDFVGNETGHVIVRCLPPGEYVLGSFSFSGFLPGIAIYTWSPDKPFSFPFHIRAGEATYIGSYMRAPSLGTSLQPTLGAAGFFVVADRATRDLPIAKQKRLADMKIASEVPDVSSLNSPALRISEP